MKTPLRLRDDPAAPADVRDLVRSGGRSRALPGETRARSAARLGRLVVAPAAAGLLLWIKGVAVAGLCAVGAVAAVRIVPALVHATAVTEAEPSERRDPPVSVTTGSPVASPIVRLAPPTAAPDDPSPPAVPVPPSSRAGALQDGPRPPTAPPAHANSRPERDPLEREAAMLEEARSVLDRDPGGALAALDRHSATFPAGRLSMERELLAVEALRRLGRSAEARARGNALLARAGGSIYEARVRATLDSLPPP
jgi:hypothetical protein